jgi:AbrB family looped-hinge helix DNA binding protein
MTITIDEAGRLVIPKKMRDALNLLPGTPIEVETDAAGLRLRVQGSGSALQLKKGFLVHRGNGTLPIDVAELINRQRSQRNEDISGFQG